MRKRRGGERERKGMKNNEINESIPSDSAGLGLKLGWSGNRMTIPQGSTGYLPYFVTGNYDRFVIAWQHVVCMEYSIE